MDFLTACFLALRRVDSLSLHLTAVRFLTPSMNLSPNISKPHISRSPVIVRLNSIVRPHCFSFLLVNILFEFGTKLYGTGRTNTANRKLKHRTSSTKSTPARGAGKPVTPSIATSQPACRLILLSFNEGLDFDNMMSGRRSHFNCLPETLRTSRAGVDRSLKERQGSSSPESQFIQFSSICVNYSQHTCSQ